MGHNDFSSSYAVNPNIPLGEVIRIAKEQIELDKKATLVELEKPYSILTDAISHNETFKDLEK